MSKVYIPFAELVDLNVERERVTNEIEKVKSEIARAKNMLSNEKFVSKAPKNKIDEEKEKLVKYEKLYEELNNTLDGLK